MRQYTGNRVGLCLLGAILLTLGAYTWLRGTALAPKERILAAHTVEVISAQAWLLWEFTLILVMLTLLSLRWLLLSLGWRRLGRRAGVGVALLCVGLREVEGAEGVVKGGVRVVGAAERLRVSLVCGPATDLGTVVRRLDRELIGRIRRELGGGEAGAVVRLHVRG